MCLLLLLGSSAPQRGAVDEEGDEHVPNVTGFIRPQASAGNFAQRFSSARFHSEPVCTTCVSICVLWGAGPRGREVSLGASEVAISEDIRNTLQD